MHTLCTTLSYAACIPRARFFWSSCVMSLWNKMMYKSFVTKDEIMTQTFLVKIFFTRRNVSWMLPGKCCKPLELFYFGLHRMGCMPDYSLLGSAKDLVQNHFTRTNVSSTNLVCIKFANPLDHFIRKSSLKRGSTQKWKFPLI